MTPRLAVLSLILIALAAPSVALAEPGPVRELHAILRAGEHRDEMYRARANKSHAAERPAEAADWREAIDATWGPGLPTDQKLAIFDALWSAIDQEYPSFGGLDVDWAALRGRFRPEIAAGVSRGRFAAIMDYLALPLHDSHVRPIDFPVEYGTPLVPGTPMLAVGQWFGNNSGTCGTSMPDGSTLIYSAVADHPLGLEAGDRILGYDGRPWKENLRALLNAQLPLSPIWWGSSPSSFDDTFTGVANLNWHLFKTMDVRKFGTGRLVHLPTARLAATQPYSGDCMEEMDIPGIAEPDLSRGQDVTYGVLPGTRIGYIRVWAWDDPSGAQFTTAVQALTQDQQTDGLIIDHRFDAGGYLRSDDDGLDMLFRGQPAVEGADVRADPSDHFALETVVSPEDWRVGARDGSEDPRFYDRPIAVLEGPGTVSQGDHAVLRLRAHPRVRTFGKPGSSAFGGITFIDADPDWGLAYPFFDTWRAGDHSHDLTHAELPPDQPVWLTPDDVAHGRDTVVEAAVRWIRGG